MVASILHPQGKFMKLQIICNEQFSYVYPLLEQEHELSIEEDFMTFHGSTPIYMTINSTDME